MNQQSAAENQPLVWDYHVILRDITLDLIYDFDSRLPFPCAAGKYMRATFPAEDLLPAEYHACLRRIPLADFIRDFWSDRSHMVDENGQALAPFPPWQAILADDQPVKLEEYLDL